MYLYFNFNDNIKKKLHQRKVSLLNSKVANPDGDLPQPDPAGSNILEEEKTESGYVSIKYFHVPLVKALATPKRSKGYFVTLQSKTVHIKTNFGDLSLV